jgi:hypothetical protein
MNLHTTAVRLDEITLAERSWPREQLDEERVELFAEILGDARQAAGTGQGWSDPLPPLVVVAAGLGGYLLADGRHRYEARRRLGVGFDVVGVQVFQANGRPPVDFAYELALLCTHGAKPLTTSEKRAAILRLIGERPDASDRAIARLVGVSNSTVSVHRRGLCDSHAVGEPVDAPYSENRQASTRREPLRWEVAAQRLAEATGDLLSSCRRLFGGANVTSAGRELYDALADLYGDEDALIVIDELGAIVGAARAHAGKGSS